MGNLKKQFGGASSFTYTVGTANGYSPVDVTVTAGTGDLSVKAVQGNQPLLDSVRSLKRYWTMNGTGVTVSMALHYLDLADIAGNESAYRLIRITGSDSVIFPDGCAGGSPCVDPNANTATINGVSSFSDWTVGEPTAPTAVDLASFTATGYDGGVFVEWKTGNEVSNLGFNIYREQGGQRSRVNSDIIAGSALKVGPSVTVRAGYSYGWWDKLSLSSQDVSYYLEDLDINGHSTLHGPFKINTVGGKPPAASQAETLSHLRGGQVFSGPLALATQAGRSAGAVSLALFDMAGKPTVKMTIKDEGWYRVTQAELAAAGFDPRSNPRNLQLFVDGVEQPLLVVGESDNSFDASDAVEFNYGEKAVQAVKEFLAYTQSSWKKKPRFVLLGGDACYDAKNYLGFGDFDLVPTRLIDTTLMETASDDWLADFNNDGVAEVAIGRLPFRTAGEAAAMVAKLTAYERSAPSEEVVLSADTDDGYSFENDSDQLRRWLPNNLRVNAVYRGRMDAEEAKGVLLEAVNRGQKLVNYVGHGSVDQWRGNLLNDADGLKMTNREGLSVFVLMTCLNGYYDDPALDSLAESLLKAEGRAVAVWASSGMCLPNDQAAMNQEFYRQLFTGNPLTIGEAAKRAKQAASSGDVRRSWILLGDPSMRLK